MPFCGRRKRKRSSKGRRPLGKLPQRNRKLPKRRVDTRMKVADPWWVFLISYRLGANARVPPPLRRKGPTFGYVVFRNARICDWGCLCIVCFLFSFWVVLHCGCSEPSSEVDGTFALWVGSATCVGEQSIRQPDRFCGPFPSSLFFILTSADHGLLLFFEAFSFSADLGFLLSSGYQEVQDVFRG